MIDKLKLETRGQQQEIKTLKMEVGRLEALPRNDEEFKEALKQTKGEFEVKIEQLSN